MVVFKQFCVTGTSLRRDNFAPPSAALERYATIEEAVENARRYHEQFGSAFAIWFRDRIVGLYDMRGHVPLCPEFR